MSTPRDVEELGKFLRLLPEPRNALYCGLYGDGSSLDRVSNAWPDAILATLDKDCVGSQVWHKPDFFVDLNDVQEIARLPRFDLVMVPYVLMYLADPLKSAERLLTRCDRLVVQESVVRRRGAGKEPWSDRNRFWDSSTDWQKHTPHSIRHAAEDDGKQLVDLAPLHPANGKPWRLSVYGNGYECMSAIWELLP